MHSRAHTQARLLVDMHVLRPHAHVSRHRAACLGFGNAGVRGRHAVGPPAHAARSGCHELLEGSSATHLCCGLDETCPTRWPQRGLFPPLLQEVSPPSQVRLPRAAGPHSASFKEARCAHALVSVKMRSHGSSHPRGLQRAGPQPARDPALQMKAPPQSRLRARRLIAEATRRGRRNTSAIPASRRWESRGHFPAPFAGWALPRSPKHFSYDRKTKPCSDLLNEPRRKSP